MSARLATRSAEQLALGARPRTRSLAGAAVEGAEVLLDLAEVRQQLAGRRPRAAGSARAPRCRSRTGTLPASTRPRSGGRARPAGRAASLRRDSGSVSVPCTIWRSRSTTVCSRDSVPDEGARPQAAHPGVGLLEAPGSRRSAPRRSVEPGRSGAASPDSGRRPGLEVVACGGAGSATSAAVAGVDRVEMLVEGAASSTEDVGVAPGRRRRSGAPRKPRTSGACWARSSRQAGCRSRSSSTSATSTATP